MTDQAIKPEEQEGEVKFGLETMADIFRPMRNNDAINFGFAPKINSKP